MATVDTKVRLTPDELLSLPGADRFELVDGELLEISMGAESSHISIRLVMLIGAYCQLHGKGLLFGPDCGYQCFADDPNRIRRPDVSFVSGGRLPNDLPPKGFIRIPPDLAAEVVSPGDSAYEVGRKAEEYLEAGTPLVWIINPDARTVLVYRADGSIIGLRENDELTGDPVLPGFRCRVSDLFPHPAPTTT